MERIQAVDMMPAHPEMQTKVIDGETVVFSPGAVMGFEFLTGQETQ